MKLNIEKLERSVRVCIIAEGLWKVSRCFMASLGRVKFSNELIMVERDRQHFLEAIKELSKSQVSARKKEYQLQTVEIARTLEEQLTQKDFKVHRDGGTLYVTEHIAKRTPVEACCPVCQSALFAVRGNGMYYHEGYTVFCPNLSCPCKEVEGCGGSIKTALDFLLHKFDTAENKQRNKERQEAMSKKTLKDLGASAYTSTKAKADAAEVEETAEVTEEETAKVETKTKGKVEAKADKKKDVAKKAAKTDDDDEWAGWAEYANEQAKKAKSPEALHEILLKKYPGNKMSWATIRWNKAHPKK